MEASSLFGSLGTMVVLTIAILVGFYLTGRLKSRRELVLSASLVVGAAIFFGQMQNRSEAQARARVETLFGLDPETDPVVFRAGGSKGMPTLRIEAIYELSPDAFEAVRSRQPSLEAPMSFKFRTGGWNEVTVDRFAVAKGAFEWRDLPRTYRTADFLHVERGHYSRQRTPDERDMAGSFLCAFIRIHRGAGPFDVVPCSSVSRGEPAGIKILAMLNERDNSLHILIE